MLRALVICPHAQLRREFELSIESSPEVFLAHSMDRYPREAEAAELVRSTAARVVFIDLFSNKEEGLAAAALLAKANCYPVALHRFRDPFLLTELMRAGIREYLWSPFEPATVDELVVRIRQAQAGEEQIDNEPQCTLCAFVPGKPGSGATTLAVQSALALERIPGTQPLLLDADLATGATGFLLGLRNSFGIHEALERSADLARDGDDMLWKEMVCRRGRLDVLASSGARVRFRFEPTHTRFLIDFACRRYRQVWVDMSGCLEEHSLDILQQCQRIVVVVSPDLPAVNMAREKLGCLGRLDLTPRIEIALNRWNRPHAVAVAEVEQALGQSIDHLFPDEPAAVHKAVLNAQAVEPASELSKECARLAEWLIGAPAPPDQPRWRFLEYITAIPDRYTRARLDKSLQ